MIVLSFTIRITIKVFWRWIRYETLEGFFSKRIWEVWTFNIERVESHLTGHSVASKIVQLFFSISDDDCVFCSVFPLSFSHLCFERHVEAEYTYRHSYLMYTIRIYPSMWVSVTHVEISRRRTEKKHLNKLIVSIIWKWWTKTVSLVYELTF